MASSDCPLDGRRAVVERRAQASEACRARESGAPVVNESSLGRLFPCSVLAVNSALHPARKQPCSTQPTVVTDLLEGRNCLLRDLEECFVLALLDRA